MLLGSLLYTILLLLLPVEIYCQASFKPGQRELHTSTFINNKLYILGGAAIDKNLTQNVSTSFFYLDFSVSFNTKNLLWEDLSYTNIVPPHYGATSVKGGKDNNTLILYGGFAHGSGVGSVYMFDPQNNTWNIWNAPNTTTSNRRLGSTGIVDYNEQIYFFDGLEQDGNSEPVEKSDMLILDAINFNQSDRNPNNAPTPRLNYGVTLLPNNNIIYIGGYDDKNDKVLSLDQVYIYDTYNDNWSVQSTSGNIPSNRDGFTAVLGLDGKNVIIFGGGSTNQSSNLTPKESLYVLDLDSFEWRIPKVSGQIPKSRMYHQANVIGNYMVISFGEIKDYDQSNEDDILLLDISDDKNYIWTDEFVINPKIKSSVKSLLGTIIGVILGFIVGGILLSYGGFLIYKRSINKQNENEIDEEDYKGHQERSFIFAGKNVFNTEPNLISVNSTSNNNYNNRTSKNESTIENNESTSNHELTTTEINSNNV